MPDVPGGFRRLDRLGAGFACLHGKDHAARPTVNLCGVRLRCALPGIAVLWYHDKRPLVKPGCTLKRLKDWRFLPDREAINTWASTPEGAPQ